MAATRRLQKELGDIRTSGMKSFRDIQVDETNILSWQGLIVPNFTVPLCPLKNVVTLLPVNIQTGVVPLSMITPVDCLPLQRPARSPLRNRQYIQVSGLDSSPYNKGAFRIEINFPAEYPFKPPKISFKTKIYHPNIDEKGQVCLPIISAENWKPATKTDQVIQALVALVNDPEPEHPLRADLAEEFLKDRKKFIKNAEEFTKKHSEKRPSD